MNIEKADRLNRPFEPETRRTVIPTAKGSGLFPGWGVKF